MLDYDKCAVMVRTVYIGMNIPILYTGVLMHYYEKANYILQRFNRQDKLHIYDMMWLKRMNSIKVVGHNVTVLTCLK